jgi:hypothetical protein
MFFRTMAIGLLLVAQAAPAWAACSGADPSVVSVAVKGMRTDGGLNHYEISGTVTNVGGASQASNVLQSVNIYKTGEKLDTKSIPPLKAGESYTFTYVSDRSVEAGNGTTKLMFRLEPAAPNSQDCGAGNSNTLTF